MRVFFNNFVETLICTIFNIKCELCRCYSVNG